MNLSLLSTFLPDELRTSFSDLIQKEIDSRDPAEGAKLVTSDEPEQMQFDFSYSKKLSP